MARGDHPEPPLWMKQKTVRLVSRRDFKSYDLDSGIRVPLEMRARIKSCPNQLGIDSLRIRLPALPGRLARQ